jgi:glycogen operon protein
MASLHAGSSDIYQWSDRSAYASVNFVVAHDGYTLHDLVSYERKHNEANGENNQDGHNDNVSRNWGAEGPTDDAGILAARRRAMRNFLATMAFSQGVPMLAHGDEIGRTQWGNNNAYAQDNEITWVDWSLEEWQRELLTFTRRVFAIRHANPVLRRRHFFQGQRAGEDGLKEVTWLRPDGKEMGNEDWHRRGGHVLGMLISGAATDETDDRGRPVRGDTLLVVLNNGEKDVTFALPAVSDPGAWYLLVDTTEETGGTPHPLDEADSIAVSGHSLVLLRHGSERRFDLAIVGRAVEAHRSVAVLPVEPGDRPVSPTRERRL